jgi:hypothetical protein
MTKTLTLGLLTLAGAGAVVAGMYLWLGLAAALITGGAGAVVAGLLVDDGSKASG